MGSFVKSIRKKNPMKRPLLIVSLLFSFLAVRSQTAAASAPLPPSDSADYFYQKGLLEKQNGRKLESLRNFEKASKYDAENRLIVTELAQAYHDLRKYAQAREMYKKLLSLGEETAPILQTLLQLSFQLKQKDDVLLFADKLKKADPAARVAWYVGRVQYDNDNYGEAIKYLTIAGQEDPSNAEIPYLIGHSYADMMQYKKAVPFFEQAIGLDSSKNFWMYELGLVCYAMHDDRNALRYIKMAGDKGYKMDNDYYENLAIAYLNVGQFDEGIAMLNKILERKPGDMNILNMVAEACYDKRKYDLAIEYWDRILEYDKENASALYMIGMAYQKKGGKENNEKGIALCDRAIQMDPSLARLKQKKMNMGL